jgi:hypothetical protein
MQYLNTPMDMLVHLFLLFMIGLSFLGWVYATFKPYCYDPMRVSWLDWTYQRYTTRKRYQRLRRGRGELIDRAEHALWIVVWDGDGNGDSEYEMVEMMC